MKPLKKLEDKIRKQMNFSAAPMLRSELLSNVLDEQEMIAKNKSAQHMPNIRRQIMKNTITRYVAAAVVVVAVLGLVKLIDGDSTSGVVWADVLTKVKASRGIIYRDWRTDVDDTSTDVSDYEISYLTPTQYRSEGFREGKPWMSMFDNRETRKRVVLVHFQKGYVLEDMKLTEQGNQKHANYQNPSWWVEMLMSCEYIKLKSKVIDGVLCEGIETTDLALASKDGPMVDRLVAQLWVSVETGYPVMFQGKFYGENSIKTTFDQFQWNVELGSSVFEPKIPEGYEQM